MENLLAPLGVQYEFIEAVDGSKLSGKEISDARRRGSGITKKWPNRQPMHPAEIGCALSHLKVYEKIVDDNLDYACILEDDIYIDHPQYLRDILEKDNLVALNKKRAFDFIYLELILLDKTRWMNFLPIAQIDLYTRWRKTKIRKNLYLCKPCQAPLWGTAGYIVNRRACEVFLKEGHPVSKPSDVLTGCAELFGIQQYILNPLPIRQNDEFESTIGHEQIYNPLVPTVPTIGERILRAFNPVRLVDILSRKSGIISFQSIIRKNVHYE